MACSFYIRIYRLLKDGNIIKHTKKSLKSISKTNANDLDYVFVFFLRYNYNKNIRNNQL